MFEEWGLIIGKGGYSINILVLKVDNDSICWKIYFIGLRLGYCIYFFIIRIIECI